jgi:1-acyl-sn-glycerol-3-phosphate acyltransferase
MAITCVAVGTLGLFARKLTPMMLRFWGRTMLSIAGIELHITGIEHLQTGKAGVALFNHQSMLDAFIVTSLMPTASVAAIKKEALYYPGVGIALWCLGFLIIDRKSNTDSRKTLGKASVRLAKESLTVFIAPEGTRSRDGLLLPLKRGGFHLAIDSGAPVIPVVIVDAFKKHPYGKWWSIPGTVNVHILPPIETRGMSVNALPKLMADIELAFRNELA